MSTLYCGCNSLNTNFGSHSKITNMSNLCERSVLGMNFNVGLTGNKH